MACAQTILEYVPRRGGAMEGVLRPESAKAIRQGTGSLELMAWVASGLLLCLLFMLLLSCSWSEQLQSAGLAAAHREFLGQTQQVWTSFTRLALHQGQGTPGTRPGITETEPNLNGKVEQKV